ncbi:unnamed protein product [Heligmosomoides polygyrus]|uniref:WAPL domain-containing protein n=1 Tax=Heligmosomoides polygyrus TaxID=6339 RepID=A0A183G5P3_HELPZ|nr:unnamed protein product [Heligmosomoides polygyrus]
MKDRLRKDDNNARIMALTALLKLTITEDQSMGKFCPAVEKLTSKAYPNSSSETGERQRGRYRQACEEDCEEVCNASEEPMQFLDTIKMDVSLDGSNGMYTKLANRLSFIIKYEVMLQKTPPLLHERTIEDCRALPEKHRRSSHPSCVHQGK